MSDVMVIGIAGGTGSGKTTITRKLLQHFSGDVSIINHDNYYKAHHDMSYEQRCKLNYDHPNAFDTDLLIRDLKELKAGKSIQCPVYDYSIHDRSEDTVTYGNYPPVQFFTFQFGSVVLGLGPKYRNGCEG